MGVVLLQERQLSTHLDDRLTELKALRSRLVDAAEKTKLLENLVP